MEESTKQVISTVSSHTNDDNDTPKVQNNVSCIKNQNTRKQSISSSPNSQYVIEMEKIISNNNKESDSIEVEQICSDKKNDIQTEQETESDFIREFKKPILFVGKRGRGGKIRPLLNVFKSHTNPVESTYLQSCDTITQNIMKEIEPEKLLEETKLKSFTESQKSIMLPYIEPSWGGKPQKNYTLEILKSGLILDNIDLSNKSCYIVGRLPSCDISLAHPTISRFHAIFQYRVVEDSKNQKGLYLYDLGSTHGTFWNGNRIRSNVYVRLYNGHMIKFGCSQRKYILQAPNEDYEAESEFSVTELKERRKQELLERERMEIERHAQLKEERLRKEEEEKEGIDWGMGEDADEETDLQENPYAFTHDEELYLKDPKKTLRGWFEREGYELQYQTEEKGFGQFLCWVDLPIEDVAGHTVKAEAIVKGKKKESVIQCATEACKILDRYGLLRQANPEGRKRKIRNWEEDDYYSSDDDNFLDRTGTIEKKREQRMRQAGKITETVETYDSLVVKHEAIVKQIAVLEQHIRNSQEFEEISRNSENGDEDALDAFMSTLDKPILSKSDKLTMRMNLQNLRKEESNLIKLMNLTKPADLPPLVSHITSMEDIQRSKKLIESRLSIGQKKERRPINEDYNTTKVTSGQRLNEMRNEILEEEEEEMMKEETIKNETLYNVTQSDNSSCNVTVATIKDPITPNINGSSDNEDENKSEYTEENESIKKIKIRKATDKKNKAKTAYEEDIYSDNYSTWVPPQNQTGDGTTSLNAKYGY